MKLVFDFGAVLVDLEKSDAIAAFDRLGVDIRPYIGTFRQGGVFALLENGDISLSDFYDEIRKIANNPTLTDDEIRTAWQNDCNCCSRFVSTTKSMRFPTPT